MDEIIGVIGATGKTGRRVADRLAARGATVRRLSRGSSPSFDWEQPDGWKAALDGVDRLYAAYVPDLAAPGADRAIATLARVAHEVGVRRVVLLSGRGEAGARTCEDILFASPVATTVVSASWFVQNFTEGMLHDAVAEGVLALPAGMVREPFIDVDDLADVIVHVLLEDGHEGRRYEVTGPESLTFAEAAAHLSAFAGREVAYVPIGFDEFHAAIAEAEGADVATLLTELCREVFDGRNEGTTSTVADLLGRPARDLSAALVDAHAERRRATANA
ncbi:MULTISPECIES: NmrA family transcriptional regulator [unclassified Agromyces]|uniref:NmrA family transcriptional regulator n=1 Tax=unclassified Agromyces TaxID=2639701 RepID=UPI0030154B80